MVTRRINSGVLWLACLALLAFGSAACSAQPSTPNYPTKAIDLVCAFGAGGASDISARLISGYLSKKWGQPINVINLPGAAAVTGTKRMYDAPPDGYTLLMDNHASSSMQAAAMVTLPYKWDDRTMIARAFTDPVFYVVKADAPWRSLKEVMEYAKSNPGSLKWSAAGVTAISTFAMALLFQAAGVNVADTNQAVFDSGAASTNAVAGGHSDITGQQFSEVTALVQAGKLRALAVVHPERIKELPDVPTVKEAGYDFFVTGWHGVSAQSKVPSYVVQKWSEALKEASKDPQYIADAAKVYKVVAYQGPEEFRKFMYDEYNKYLPIAEQMGIRK